MATTYYITPGANQDVTSRVLTNDMQILTQAATVNIVTTAYHTVCALYSLDMNMTLTATNVTNVADGNTLDVLITSDLVSPGSTYTLTFGTGFKMPSNTIAVTGGKHATAKFTFFQGYWTGASTLSAS